MKQIAIAKFFDGEAPDPLAEARVTLPPSPPPSTRRETLLNQSLSFPRLPAPSNRQLAPRIVPQPESQRYYTPPLLFQILLAPFDILTKIVRGSFSILGFFLSFLPRLFSRILVERHQARIRSERRPLSPPDTAARFTREFEDIYGSHKLPFFEGGYAQAFDIVKRDLKFLLVVILSTEHDDTSAFVEETLLSTEVAEYVNGHQKDILIWAGNVQDSEAYHVSSVLNCTKFPFTALIAPTPQDSATSVSTIAQIMGLVSPSNYVIQLRQAIDQQRPILAQYKIQRSEQQAARNLREEQNSAYERSLAVDRARAKQRKEAETAKAQAENEARARAEAAQREAQKAQQWKKWRARSIAAEPGAEAKNTTRVSIRMASGERLVRRFDVQASTEELYAFVECYEILKSDQDEAVSKPEAYQHNYSFRLVSPMPRAVYDVTEAGGIGSKIGRSGNLIVEPIEQEDDND